MLRLIARRLALLPVILIVVAAMTFGMASLSPYDPVDAFVGVENGVSAETKADVARAWGLDQPVHEQFGRWLGNLVQGDLGTSRIAGGQPVADEILARAGPTIVLVGGALCLVLAGGLLLGTLAAAFRGSAFDMAVRGWCHFATAAPSFWIALLALYVFSVELDWLPAGGVADVRAEDAGRLDPSHLVLPMLCLAVTQVSWFTLFVRTTVLEVLRDEHVQFARAQGLAERTVLVSHALRSALIPFVTLVGIHLSELIGGAVLIESVFAWPGLGLLTRDAALGVDLPLLVAITLGASVLVVVGNLLADVLYRALDPRVREAAA